jgi:branched-chain amino acid transport system permease protein
VSFPALLSQLANGLAQASTLFLLASGLSLIFGVTRVVNFAHGSLYMVGTYAGIWLAGRLGGGAPAFWVAVALAALAVAVLGTLVELLVLRRIYRAPELFQLLATFAVVLVVKDLALLAWGPEDLLGPRAPGLSGAVELGGVVIPEYDLFLIVLGPVVLVALQRLLQGTRWGTLVRAATEDREMVGALGVNERWLFTGVFALGSLLAGLAGALQMPREPASLGLDLIAITDAFVVVVVGGLGSLRGAFYAALLIGIVKALCFALGTVEMFGTAVNFTRLTLVVEFLLMAVTLAFRPWGLAGRPPHRSAVEATAGIEFVRVPSGRFWFGALAALGIVCTLPAVVDEYALVLATDCIVFALFAASLHLLMGPGGMASFGHAAYFGIGAYCAGLLLKLGGWPMGAALAAGPVVAAAFALLFGWFCVRLSGVYLAMLTLAFSQIVWSVTFQWEEFTGGSNGVVGVWPAAWAADKTRFFWLTAILCGLAIVAVWRVANAPFGFSLRAARDAPRRAAAIGIPVARTQWLAFPLAGGAAGLAGALYAFSKGSIAPDVMAIARSVDGLVMVLLGGLHTLTGPVVGAVVFTWLQDEILRRTEYWRLILGLAVLALVLLFPLGIVGSVGRLLRGERA